ncbi:MAG TPA: UDP-N-acetylmuramoyl-tripeptide--D-alanyl-D-alanine ligase, partial [Firmicutes bacterium]|nr:UDP-N-acetylmuramoyl-tripeptide--D-alanyl-D-alanine ligase [Bacillota bacterium]
MPEFTLNEVITATAGKLSVRGNFQKISGVSIDSRTLVPGAVFFAIQGTNFDGHNYITDAAEKGAAAVVCERITDLPSDWPGAVIQVADSLQAFGRLACFHRQRFAVPVIGITGSNGKTTTKELIAAILAEKKRVVKTEKNYNNEIGLPLTLFKMDADTEAVVIEMGMRGMGQIAYLADLAKPTMGVITNIGLTHLELLGTQAAIATAKAELMQALPVSGWAILNADDPLVASMASQCEGGSLFYSLQQGSDLSRPSPALFLVDATTKATSEEVTVDGRWGKFRFTLPLLGRHNIANALAAATASLALGLTTEEAARGLQKATT